MFVVRVVSENWLHLPIILLFCGFRSTFNEGVPGEFFVEQKLDRTEKEINIIEMWMVMADLKLTMRKWHVKREIFVHTRV